MLNFAATRMCTLLVLIVNFKLNEMYAKIQCHHQKYLLF